jgi:hypothetical protein
MALGNVAKSSAHAWDWAFLLAISWLLVWDHLLVNLVIGVVKSKQRSVVRERYGIDEACLYSLCVSNT